MSCSEEDEENTTDTTAPVIAEVTAVSTPDNDSTPDYTFSSSEAGTITYGGSCSSYITSADTANTTITLDSLSDGTYSDCTITVTDTTGNVSNTLTITSFEVDATAPVIAEVTAVTNPTTDSNPSYTFSSDEARTITYGGSCSSSTGSATIGNNTITLATLSTGTYSDCTIAVTDITGNTSTLKMSIFSVGVRMGGAIQSGSELSLSNAVTTLAGTGSCGSLNGTGTSASFCTPVDVTTDGTNIYVTDYYYSMLRKIVISTGVVTEIAGMGYCASTNGTGTSAGFCGLNGITTDGINLYVVENKNHLIRQIVISTGIVTTIAGTGSSGSSNGTGTSASFNGPAGLTTDGTNLYVTDYENDLIRQIVISTGVVSTVAGTGSYGSANGTGTSASFSAPYGITTDGTNLYVADFGNDLIRKIVISTGVVTTVAGTGSSGSVNGTGTSASFNGPTGLTTDGTNLYVVDRGNHLIRKIVISTGVVTTVAGTGSSGSVNGTGTSASFYKPRNITTDGTSLYIADRMNERIRKIE
ncbi:MAG: hypothetical protein ACKVHI_04615 [Candidatus Puniceispirillales bacterium]